MGLGQRKRMLVIYSTGRVTIIYRYDCSELPVVTA
jgi:hypothetical protein